jgi:hypothetical protein
MSIYVVVDLWEWNCQHDRCQCCGFLRARAYLKFETHHIAYRGQGGTNEACNLLCLCRRCHQQAAHNGQSKWNLTTAHLLWVKQHCGDGTWDHERLLEMWRGTYNTRTFSQGAPDKFTPAVLPAVYLEERKRFGYGRKT